MQRCKGSATAAPSVSGRTAAERNWNEPQSKAGWHGLALSGHGFDETPTRSPQFSYADGTREEYKVGEIPEGAVALAMSLSDAPRDMVVAGFRLGVEHAAKIIEVCTDQQTDAAMHEATPKQCFEVAAMLVRNKGGEAAEALAAGGDLPVSSP